LRGITLALKRGSRCQKRNKYITVDLKAVVMCFNLIGDSEMNRYKKDHNINGWAVVDTERGGILHTDDIVKRLNDYESLLAEADEYLSTNKLTSIGSGSILHRKFIDITGKY